MHGDLGCVTGDDAVICISHSGNTQELVHAMAHVQQRSPRPVSRHDTAASWVAFFSRSLRYRCQ